MTDSDWQYVRANVGLFRTVTLMCDGYKVQISEARSGNKIIITVYVNGFMRGKWLNGDCEIGRKFMRPSVRFAYSARFRKDMQDIMGKREYKKKSDVYEKKITVYYPFWNNINSLIKHLKANCTSIKIHTNEAE